MTPEGTLAFSDGLFELQSHGRQEVQLRLHPHLPRTSTGSSSWTRSAWWSASNGATRARRVRQGHDQEPAARRRRHVGPQPADRRTLRRLRARQVLHPPQCPGRRQAAGLLASRHVQADKEEIYSRLHAASRCSMPTLGKPVRRPRRVVRHSGFQKPPKANRSAAVRRSTRTSGSSIWKTTSPPTAKAAAANPSTSSAREYECWTI